MLIQAAEAYSGAIALDSTEYSFFSNRSLVRLKLGNKEGALEDAERAKELCPNNVKVHWRLGTSLEAVGRYVDAASAYYEGLKLDMDNKEMKTAFEKAVSASTRSASRLASYVGSVSCYWCSVLISTLLHLSIVVAHCLVVGVPRQTRSRLQNIQLVCLSRL